MATYFYKGPPQVEKIRRVIAMLITAITSAQASTFNIL